MQAALNDPCTGLLEIKNEVRDIECKLDNPEYGLAEIKREVRDIEDKLDNPEYGLAEIKAEVRQILEECCDGNGNGPVDEEAQTSGPMFKANQASSVIVQVLNYFSESVEVSISVLNLPLSGTKEDVPGSPVTVTIDADETFAQAFDISDSVAYEVQIFTDNPQWVRYWSGSRTQPANVALTASTILPENIVLHAMSGSRSPLGNSVRHHEERRAQAPLSSWLSPEDESLDDARLDLSSWPGNPSDF